MSLRELYAKVYWSADDLATAISISVPTARNMLRKIQKELREEGYLGMPTIKVPIQEVIKRLDISLEHLQKYADMDAEIIRTKK
ncbi:MAG: hypothetical protein WCI62_04150 [Erysipelotrichaceae bacterium]